MNQFTQKVPSLRELRQIMHRSSQGEPTNWHDPFLLVPLVLSALLTLGFAVLATLRFFIGPLSIHYVLPYVLLAFSAVVAYMIYMVRETIREVIRYRKEGWPDLLDFIDRQRREQDALLLELEKCDTENLKSLKQDLKFQIGLSQEDLDSTRDWLTGLAKAVTVALAVLAYLSDKSSLHTHTQIILLICAVVAAVFFFSLLSFIVASRTKRELARMLHMVCKILKRRKSKLPLEP